MGASSSHLGPRLPPPGPTHHHHHHRGPPKRSLSSFFICGASSSFRSPSEIDDDTAELLVSSAEHGSLNKFRTPRKDSAPSSGTGSGIASPNSETGVSSEGSVVANDNRKLGDSSGGVEASHRGKYLSESKELVPPHQLISAYRSGEIATCYMDQPSVNPDSASGKAHINVSSANISVKKDVCSGVTYHGSPSSNELGESSSDEFSIGNHVTEGMAFPNYDSSTTSVSSDSPLNNHLPRDDTVYEAGPPGLGLLVSEREQDRRDGNTHHVDVVNVSSSVVSSSSSEVNNEARRNSRRLFWDAFSRRSGRYADSLSANNDFDNLGHQDRWLLDFSSDFLSEGVGGDFRSYVDRTQGNYEQRWQSRSEILERLRGGLDGNGPQTAVCPTGIHPEGTCSCESILRAESGVHASISRIVMLAEALFEVLDEIHRQHSSVSLPVVSLPASESVVNTFPVKNYRKPERSESDDDVAKCYICLAEYEEGDKIRILPCHHEYHMPCIDKWLKEIHGICPLCRGDVREGFTQGSDSTLGIPSL